MNETIRMASTWLARLASPEYWKSLPGRYHAWRTRHARPIVDREGLQVFIRTRASHVAQTALYGYLRTRAGTRFPELFSDDEFLKSINIAKWHVWLACISDLSVCAGGLVRRRAPAPAFDVGRLMRDTMEALLLEAGTPAEAGPDYDSHAASVRARIALCDWNAAAREEWPFSQSPGALVHWAPVVDELKQLDEEIVRNSVRFRWREVREQLHALLDAEALVASVQPDRAQGEGSSRHTG